MLIWKLTFSHSVRMRSVSLFCVISYSHCVHFVFFSSHRNVMMRLNLQLTMGSFSLTLFGLIGVAFGMNLTTVFEDVRQLVINNLVVAVTVYRDFMHWLGFISLQDPRAFWLVTGFMFLGSGLIWRRLLSFLGRHLETSVPPRVIHKQTLALRQHFSVSLHTLCSPVPELHPYRLFLLYVLQIPPVWKRNMRPSDIRAGVRWSSNPHRLCSLVVYVVSQRSWSSLTKDFKNVLFF